MTPARLLAGAARALEAGAPRLPQALGVAAAIGAVALELGAALAAELEEQRRDATAADVEHIRQKLAPLTELVRRRRRWVAVHVFEGEGE